MKKVERRLKKRLSVDRRKLRSKTNASRGSHDYCVRLVRGEKLLTILVSALLPFSTLLGAWLGREV